MYKKTIASCGKNIELLFTNKPYFENDTTIVMGFPYNMEVETFSINDVEKVKGYYCFIKINDDNITIINDIMGNYRTYYLEKDNTIYISDDFLTLFNLLSKEERIPNEFEIEYWDKHRYTTGGETFVKNIHKLKPACMTKITKNNIEENIYFKKAVNKPDRKKHYEEVLADLRNTVSIIKQLPEKKFLLFSGGADSTLLVKLLQEQNVDFIPVFGKMIPTNSMNLDDIYKVKMSAEKLNINVEEIEIKETNKLPQSVIDKLFTDRWIAPLYYGMIKTIKEKYGENIIILNGQSADSIFCFGPTDKNLNNYNTRCLLFNPFNFITRIIQYNILKIFWKSAKNFRLPKNEKEFFISFLDEKGYRPIIDKTKNKEYFNYINQIFEKYKAMFADKYNLMMYLKIYTYGGGE